MRNQNCWKPSKYIYRQGNLVASKDSAEVGIGSRLYANLVARNFEDVIKKYAQGSLIDLGCGKAPLFQVYRHLVGNIICTDWQKAAHHCGYIDFECDLSNPLPIGNKSFDTIILSDVLEHIPNPALLWHEMTRILRDNGCLLVSVPFYYALHEAPHDYYRFTEYALRHFVRSSNMSIEVLKPLGGSPEIFTDLLAKHLSNTRLVGKSIASAIQATTLAFVRRGIGKWISEKSSAYFPIGYILVAKKITATKATNIFSQRSP